MNVVGPVTIIPSVANNMTSTTVVTSTIVDMRWAAQMSIQAVWTGTPVGTFSVQGSLDYSASPSGAILTAGTWNDLGISLTAPAGSASSALVDMALTGVPYVKLVYTNASGTGTLTALAFGR